MHRTINSIIDKNTDFKVCTKCGCINWYENEHCHNCGDNDFRDYDDEDTYDLETNFEPNDEIEV